MTDDLLARVDAWTTDDVGDPLSIERAALLRDLATALREARADAHINAEAMLRATNECETLRAERDRCVADTRSVYGLLNAECDRACAAERERDEHAGYIKALTERLNNTEAERDEHIRMNLAADNARYKAEAERDALAALLRELVACEDEHDSIITTRLYGKPHLPEHKARELDHRQRRNEAWRNARQFDDHLRGEGEGR